MKRTSIKNIADKLGVSNATVSLVLSGKQKEGRVGKDLAEKIRLTAKEMNYQPNNIARSLRMGISKTIGLIVADISNSFFSSLAFYIQEEAEKYGYSVIIANSNENDEKMGAMISELRSRQVDGFLIVPTEHSEDYIKDLINNNIPLVLLDRYFPFVPTNYVVIDNYQASLEATKLLIERNCKKIALITYENNLPHILERKSGYVDALTYADMTDSIFIKEVRYTHIDEDVDFAILDILRTGKDIDGIYFTTNSISVRGLKMLMQRGIKIPEDMQVVCFDKNEAFDIMSIPIPYIMQPIDEIGKKSVEILISAIENKHIRKEDFIFAKLQPVLLNVNNKYK